MCYHLRTSKIPRHLKIRTREGLGLGEEWTGNKVQRAVEVKDYRFNSTTLRRLALPELTKTRLMRSLVTSIFLYACESWTVTAELKRRIQAMEMRCYCKILRTSNKDHVTKGEVRAEIQQAIGPHEDLLTIVKRRKLQWYGHVSRLSGLAKTILQGTVKGGRKQGRQRKRLADNIRE